ncbi:hypothetical protein FHG87_020784 [Trinorchestia longiramus]|nr:hypothetical protein FHG87_020784 [Trinorchestia longiramus]
MKSSLICLLLLAAVTCAAPPAGEAKMANMVRMANMAKMAEVAKVSHDETEEVSREVGEAEMAEVVDVAEMVDVVNWAEGAADTELEAWEGRELEERSKGNGNSECEGPCVLSYLYGCWSDTCDPEYVLYPSGDCYCCFTTTPYQC